MSPVYAVYIDGVKVAEHVSMMEAVNIIAGEWKDEQRSYDIRMEDAE